MGAYYVPKGTAAAVVNTTPMSSIWNDGRSFQVKYTYTSGFFIHFEKPGWSFIPNKHVEIVINFEHDTDLTIALGWLSLTHNNGRTLEMNGWGYDASMRFLREFGAAERVGIFFRTAT